MGMMGQHDGLPLRGRVTIRRASDGGVLADAPNLITTAGKGLVGDLLRDASGYDTGVTYVGISTDTTAPAAGDTTLAGEVSRKALVSKSRSGNVVTFSAFYPAADAPYYIRKIGVWGHSTATATLGTGVLFAAALVSFDNSDGSDDLLIDYTLTIG